MIGQDTYYGRPEISNSDLSELNKYFLPSNVVYDLEQAYRFGNLVDAMITEPMRCDHIRKQVDGVQFSDDEWGTAYEMMKVFRKDSFCQQMMKMCEGQRAFINPSFFMEYEGFPFSLPTRCKFDLFSNGLGYGGDIKSTVATTQKQFEDAFYHFDYDRSRAWYMDTPVNEFGIMKDFVIGISKKYPYRIFKIFIDRNSPIYKSGKEKYEKLAFKYWYLFAETEVAA